MRLVDTHCHLDLGQFHDDIDAVIKRAVSGGVVRMIVPGINLDSSRKAVELAREHDAVYAAAGVHPHDADKCTGDTFEAIKSICVSEDKVVAIGEVGLDYYRKHSCVDNQRDVFRGFAGLARETGLPLIMHNRDADSDFMGIIEDFTDGIRGVVHCFSGDAGFLDKILSRGFYVSFAGNITFKKSDNIRELIRSVPLERLLLETDSPYISPEPVRGKRNEPLNVNRLVPVYSGIYGLTPVDIARITTHNANSLFGLGIEEKSEIAYSIRDSLYLNITNRCTNNCTFCTRDVSNYVKGHNLKLERDPGLEEIISEMGDISGYEEVVFCGFGEPTLRLDVVKEIASLVKEKGKKVRLVTNGEGNIINGRSIVDELAKLVDRVSVSLNADDEVTYCEVCRPVYGPQAYHDIITFIKECIQAGMEVEITCLDLIGAEKVKKCGDIADELGAGFRLRHLNVVG